MKLPIDRYTRAVLKENILFLIPSIVFIGVLFLFLPGQISDYQELLNKKNMLENDVVRLEKKRIVIYSFNATEIKDLATTLNTLLPQKEDFFSIFQALDNISAQTGFVITSYTITPSENASGKLALTVSATGTPDAFMKFLENYQYKSGRLITMDSIQFVPSTSQSAISVNFYSKEIKVAESDNIPKIDKKLIEKIKSINADLKSSGKAKELPSELNTKYSPKSNPFEL